MLLVDQERVVLEVHTVPGQAQHFTLPQAGEDGHEVDQLVRLAFDDGQKPEHLVVGQRLDLRLLYAGNDHRIQRVCADVAELFGLLHRPVQRTVEILDRLGGESLFVQQLVVQMLDHVRGQFAELDLAEIRLEMGAHMTVIDAERGGLEVARVLLELDIQPGAELHVAGVGIDPLVDLSRDLRQFLPNLFLRISIDRSLDLLAGFGTEADRVTGLPAPIRAFSDRACAFCVLC